MLTGLVTWLYTHFTHLFIIFMETDKITTPAPPLDHKTIAHDFKEALHGKLNDEQIAEGIEVLTTIAPGFGANGNVVSLIFYLQFQVNVTDGKSFNGKAGGLSTPGGGALFGTVYTHDIIRLYRDTISFQFTALLHTYLSIIFFDANSNVLGTFQAGGLSTVNGHGGGTGNWA